MKLSQAEAGFEVHQPNAVFVSPCLTAQLCLRAGGRPSEPPLTAVPATADRIKRGKKKIKLRLAAIIIKTDLPAVKQDILPFERANPKGARESFDTLLLSYSSPIYRPAIRHVL